MVNRDPGPAGLCLRLLVCLLLAWPLMPQAATISVETRPPGPVTSDESFQILFRAEGHLDAEPDFEPLQRNFEILSTSHNSSTRILNGGAERSTIWTLTVLPKEEGNLTIPAIAFGSDTSPRASIRVTGDATPVSSRQDEQIFLKVSASVQDPYVQSQVIYKVELFRTVATANASLSEPEVDSGNAVIERIDSDRNYMTNIDGRLYRVVERRYAIYPQISGELVLAPVRFRGRVARGSFSVFDPFGPRPDTIVRRSEALHLQVRPVPPEFTGDYWLPAREVKLEESWSPSPTQFRVGEPVIRTLTLTADGQTASQLPELPEWASAEHFKHYPDQPMLENDNVASGILGSRREKTTLIPGRAGDYTLPAMRIPWWDTGSNSVQYAVLPERRITVDPAAADAAQQGGFTPAPLGRLPAPQAQGSGGNDAQAPANAVPEQAAREPGNRGLGWPVLSLAALLATFLAGASLYRHYRHRPGAGSARPRLREIRRDLKQACLQQDARRARDCLLQWGRYRWPDDPPLGPVEIGRRCHPELEQAVLELNAMLYRHHPGQWDGPGFWRVFERIAAADKRTKRQEKGRLEPLYRL